MQKLIKRILEMNDSKDLNEKKGAVANTPYEEEVKGSTAATPNVNNSSEVEKPKEENSILTGEIVSLILGKEVTVELEGDKNNRAILPYDQFKFEEKPMVGDKVSVRLEEKNGQEVITEIVSLEKPHKESENSNEEDSVEEVEEETNPIDDVDLAYLNKDFVLETMSIPTDSHNEFRMVVYIIQFARRNGIKYDFDAGFMKRVTYIGEVIICAEPAVNAAVVPDIISVTVTFKYRIKKNGSNAELSEIRNPVNDSADSRYGLSVICGRSAAEA